MLHCIKIILIVLSLSIIGCDSPAIPPEVKQAEEQEHTLWREGAVIYAPQNYNSYKATLQRTRDNFIKESTKFAWFKNYDKVTSDYRVVLNYGNGILKKIENTKNEKSNLIKNRLILFESKLKSLNRLTLLINEGRFARKNLSKAELAFKEATSSYEKGDYFSAEKQLTVIPDYIKDTEKTITPVISRFTDKAKIEKWRNWVEQTVSDSKKKGITAIIVSKVDRSLILYKAGLAVKTYEVGLGRNGFHDKLHSGDFATPEGKYRIIKKVPNSRYYKALLINYPNDDDKKQFNLAVKKGLVPSKTGIGGLIEIHGGGKDGMTYGCISLDDEYMKELFNLTEAGTPVTIVGALDYDNAVSSLMKGL